MTRSHLAGLFFGRRSPSHGQASDCRREGAAKDSFSRFGLPKLLSVVPASAFASCPGHARSRNRDLGSCPSRGAVIHQFSSRGSASGTSAPLRYVRTSESAVRKASMGASLNDIMDVWVGPDDASATKVPASSMTSDTIFEYLRGLTQSQPEPVADTPEGADEPPPLIEIPDDMTLEDLQELSCNAHKMEAKPKQMTKKPPRVRQAQRSGGFTVAVTPDAYEADALEFVCSESCSQRYLFLARLKDSFPTWLPSWVMMLAISADLQIGGQLAETQDAVWHTLRCVVSWTASTPTDTRTIGVFTTSIQRRKIMKQLSMV